MYKYLAEFTRVRSMDMESRMNLVFTCDNLEDEKKKKSTTNEYRIGYQQIVWRDGNERTINEWSDRCR